MFLPTSLMRLITGLWHRLSSRRQIQFALVLGLMILASLAEALSVGVVLPFLAILTAPDRVFTNRLVQPFIRLLEATEPQDLLLPFTLIFVGTVLLAGGIRLGLAYVTTRFSYAVGADFSVELYRRTLYQSYSVHISRNSSEIINAINGKSAMLIGSVLLPVLSLFSAIFLLVTVSLSLVALDPLVTLLILGGFGVIYGLILQLTRERLKRNSKVIAIESTQVIKSLQEGLGGIRDVLIDGSQALFCEIYQNADRRLRLAQGSNTFISSSPRYIIETLGMVLIALLAYTMSQREGGMATAVPILGALALGAQRLLPVLQQAYGSITIIRGAEATLRDLALLLAQPLPANLGIMRVQQQPFVREIVLKDVSFSYVAGGALVLQNINLVLPRGKRIGFIGATGSGKSTLLDVIMGLLRPTFGGLYVDNKLISNLNCRNWQMHVAHVPQCIYLSDSSIEENIAFGVPRDEIDPVRVRDAAKKAQIDGTILSWPEEYKTNVGERGVRLSGGQRQRLGIARALYKQADVIVFDEATSALDNETERMVMESIDALGPDLTILIVAHRLTTLRNCNSIVELRNGQILRTGSYQELIKTSYP